MTEPSRDAGIAAVVASDSFGSRVDVRPVFERVRNEILRVLPTLKPDDWNRETAAAPWTVRDVVAHMAGDDLNRLSRSRDHYAGDGPAKNESLAAFIHRINDEWVRATARLSPAVLQELLASTTPQVLEFWRAVDLDELGEPVTWVSPHPAPVWLDCARDFTEYWLHLQQIREATRRISPEEDDGTHEALDTLLRAMPLTLNEMPRADNATLGIYVHSSAGGWWAWHCRHGAWSPTTLDRRPDTWLRFEGSADLWRLCSRMITPSEAAAIVTVAGDGSLARQALQIVSIIR